MLFSSHRGSATINGNEISISEDWAMKEVMDYLNEINMEELADQQCTNDNDCDVYYDDKLVASVHDGISIGYKDGEIIYKYDENNQITIVYKNGEEKYIKYENPEKMYMYLSDLEVGTNVLKINVADGEEEAEYIINIVRSEKEIDNNPSEELNEILEEIVANNDITEDINNDTINNIVNPSTGLLFDLILGVMGMGMIATIYYIYYKGKVKN